MKELKSHHLQYLFLELTKKCNLNCLHCGSDCSKESDSPELTTQSWLKIIDYLRETFSNKVALVITGGEPLVHPNFIEIVEYINKNGLRWGMVTNGMLLNKNMMHKLINAGISSLTISLDGLKESHNWLRNNPHSFDKAIQAIELIGKSALLFKDVVTCVSPRNISELNGIASLLIDYGIKEWRLFRIFPAGRAQDNEKLYLNFHETQNLIEWIKLNKKGLRKKGLNVNLSCEGWVPFETDKKIRDYPFFCRSGINIASILADGNITGCSNNEKGFHVGNILKDDFAFLWENKFDIFREKKWLSSTYCTECNYFKSCNGSSIHLWQMGNFKPNFCYAVDMSTIKSSDKNPL